MIVVFSGMGRSGSTWSYNVVREIMRHAGIALDPESGLHDAGSAVDALVERGAAKGRPLLIKCHIPGLDTIAAMAAGRVVNIYTYRDPRDAAASISRTFGTSFKGAARWVHRWLVYLDRVAGKPATVGIAYPRIGAEPETVVAELAVVLGVELKAGAAAEIADALRRDRMRRRAGRSSGKVRYVHGIAHDTDTLLTEHHIPHEAESDWRVHLTPAQARFTSWLWRDWLARFGIESDARSRGGLLHLPERWYFFVKLRPWAQDPFRAEPTDDRSPD